MEASSLRFALKSSDFGKGHGYNDEKKCFKGPRLR